MKTIDVKSLLIGALLTSTIFLSVAADSSTSEFFLGAAALSPSISENDGPPIWPWLLAIVLVGGQIWGATKVHAFHWPDLFRILGTLSFAAFAFTIAIFLADAPKRIISLQVFPFLLLPLIGFISCYLIAHLLQTFNMIKENTGENTGRLRAND